MNKVNAKLWKEIQSKIYPDPHKTHEAMYELVTHSVQEAKAERDEEIIEKIKGGVLSYFDINHIFTVGSSLSTKDRADLIDSLVIKSLLSTLNTKEECYES